MESFKFKLKLDGKKKSVKACWNLLKKRKDFKDLTVKQGLTVKSENMKLIIKGYALFDDNLSYFEQKNKLMKKLSALFLKYSKDIGQARVSYHYHFDNNKIRKVDIWDRDLLIKLEE